MHPYMCYHHSAPRLPTAKVSHSYGRYFKDQVTLHMPMPIYMSSSTCMSLTTRAHAIIAPPCFVQPTKDRIQQSNKAGTLPLPHPKLDPLCPPPPYQLTKKKPQSSMQPIGASSLEHDIAKIFAELPNLQFPQHQYPSLTQ